VPRGESNVRKLRAITVAGGLIATASLAVATEWTSEEIINLDDMLFTFHDPFTPANEVFDFDILLEENNRPVIGFSVSFDYVDMNDDMSWASDIEFQISSPGESTWIVGQEQFNGGDPWGDQDDIWDFDGPRGEFSGSYSSDHFPWKDDPQAKGGTWNFMFTDTWDGDTQYNNVVVTLYKIPAPGALAMLGVAGLLGAPRRRRRS
jgi:hypothetical protein